MNIEQQVCTLEQAKKLEELGVLQSAFWFWCKYFSEMIILRANEVPPKSEEYAAYTVAELGEMLPNYFYSVQNGFMGGEWGCSHTSDDYLEEKFKMENVDEFILKGCKTEAEARAAMLIYLLEKKLTTAAECNKRLSEN